MKLANLQVHRSRECAQDGRDECRDNEPFLEVLLLDHVGVVHLADVVYHGVWAVMNCFAVTRGICG